MFGLHEANTYLVSEGMEVTYRGDIETLTGFAKQLEII